MRHSHSLVWITTLAIASACGDGGMIATTEASSSSSTSTSTSTSTTSMSTSTTSTGTTATGSTSTGAPTTSAPPTSTTFDDCVVSTICDSDSLTSWDTSTTTGTSSSTGTGTSTDSSSGDTSGSSTGSSSGTGVLPCENGAVDQDETDVDCGGMVCGPCANGQMCGVNADCQSSACAGGQCVAPACLADADCVTPCSMGTCDPGSFTCVLAPINEGEPCEGGDLCATAKTCSAGLCAGGQPKDCAALDTVCGTGTCDPDSGACVTGPDPNKDGLDCDDDNACTATSTCQNGGCGDPDDPGYLLHEDFGGPDPGWQLGETWEIGPAAASPNGGGASGKDPASDHTASGDEMLAGQFIGGLLTSDNTTPGQFHCLTSPSVDASGLAEVWLTFWRHLHSDHTNYAVSRIEVFDGSDWVTLEEGYPVPATNDAAWKEIKLDLSAHANPMLQVRICHLRNLGAYNYGGWSVDDVTIGPISCTP